MTLEASVKLTVIADEVTAPGLAADRRRRCTCPGRLGAEHGLREALRGADVVLITAEYAREIPAAQLNAGVARRQAVWCWSSPICGSGIEPARIEDRGAPRAGSSGMNSELTGSAGFEGPASVIDAQVEAMSQRVAQNRDRRCAQLRADASAQAQGILRAARKEARANVVDAVTRERKQREQALRLARASALLEERQRAQQQMTGLLQQMWAAVDGRARSAMGRSAAPQVLGAGGRSSGADAAECPRLAHRARCRLAAGRSSTS